MSRRTIIAVKPIETGGNYLPQSAPLIEMNGLAQVTETDGSHCLENDLIRAYRAGTSFYTKDYIVGNLNANVSTLGESGLEPYRLIGSLNYNEIAKHLYGIWEEKPRPVVITGTTAGNTLTVQSGTGIYKRTVPCENGATLVYNLIPGRTYNWTESGTNRSGSFKTSGTVRQIKIDIPNFRDVGGYPVYASEASGAQPVGRMRYGKLYRGMGYRHVSETATKPTYVQLYYTNSKDAFDEMATRLGIVGELDLRAYSTNTSTSYAKNPGYTGVADWYKQIQIAGYDSVFDTGSSNMNRDMSTTTKGTSAYHVKLCLEHILSKLSSGGIYFHCKTGADRTGTLAAILMAICGCSIGDIVKEWELTSFCRSGYGCSISEYPESTSGLNIRTWLRWVYKNTTSGTLRERVETLLVGRCGVSSSTIASLRDALINWNDGTDDSDWTVPVSYAFQTCHLQARGASGSGAEGFEMKGSTFNEWEFAEFPVSAGDVVRIGVNDGTKVLTVFAESSGGLLRTALGLNNGGSLDSGWDNYEVHYYSSTHPLYTEKVNGVTHYYAKYTVGQSGMLLVGLKVNSNTTASLGGAYVKINGEQK